MNIIKQYFKYCIITGIIIVGAFLIFMPLNVVLPEFPLSWVPSGYQKYSLYHIFGDLHIRFTTIVLILALIVMGLVVIGKKV